MTTYHWKTLSSVSVPALAQPLLDFLENEGIECRVKTDDTMLDSTRGAVILVEERDFLRAEALLAAFWEQNEGEASPEDWELQNDPNEEEE